MTGELVINTILQCDWCRNLAFEWDSQLCIPVGRGCRISIDDYIWFVPDWLSHTNLDQSQLLLRTVFMLEILF